MTADNPTLEDLVRMLVIVHRDLQRLSVINRADAASTADSHARNRRLISPQPANTPHDIRLLLKTAEMAQWLDPHFTDEDAGSALDLLRRAVIAIEDLHARNAHQANVMMGALLRPKE